MAAFIKQRQQQQALQQQNQQQQPGQQPMQGQPQGQPQGQVVTSSAQQQQPMTMGQPQMVGNMPQQQQQQQQPQNFGNFQQPAPPYPGQMRPGGAQGGQYGGPNMMHQGAMGGHGPQTSVSLAAQQM